LAQRTQDFGQSSQNKKDSIELEGKVIEQLHNALPIGQWPGSFRPSCGENARQYDKSIKRRPGAD
jgi:hypothetical protein